ncbi:MAG: hypothetical protein MSG64_17525 [Pyrinomonadaceae bacterium MAG19_C2-C3]|nr:hypothetical protein [Pyrinomonadaceae bacterium MAG19_C2-C3]
MKPFSMSRFCSVWHCEGEYEVDGNLVYVYEPLHYTETLTETDSPHWGDMEITFYRKQQLDWVRVSRHLMFARQGYCSDIIMLPPPRATQERTMQGQIVELTSGKVIWRNHRWSIRWQGYTHSRMALMIKAGVEWYKDPDKELPDSATYGRVK